MAGRELPLAFSLQRAYLRQIPTLVIQGSGWRRKGPARKRVASDAVQIIAL
jgi:hypothetical protein